MQVLYRLTVKATVVGGLIVAGVVATAGIAISLLTTLSIGEIALYVGIPAVGLGVVVGIAVAARRVWKKAIELRDWQHAISVHAITTTQEFQRYTLRDVISEAEDKGWTVETDADGIDFESPDEDRAHFDSDVWDPIAVARELANLTPYYFDDEWYPPVSAVVLGHNGKIDELESRLVLLETSIERLSAAQSRQISQVVLNEAARLGWNVEEERGTERVTFRRGKANFMAGPEISVDEFLSIVSQLTTAQPRQ